MTIIITILLILFITKLMWRWNLDFSETSDGEWYVRGFWSTRNPDGSFNRHDKLLMRM
jgi:hypothetical protein